MIDIPENPVVPCTCGGLVSGTVVVFNGLIEHHCTPPSPCWVDDPLARVED